MLSERRLPWTVLEYVELELEGVGVVVVEESVGLELFLEICHPMLLLLVH